MGQVSTIGQRQTRRDLEYAVADYSQRLHAAGWVANHDGNISVRLEADALITPTAVSKADVERSKLLVVDERGQRVSGRYRPFSELNLHLYAYRRPDAGRDARASSNGNGSAVAGVEILSTMMAEPVEPWEMSSPWFPTLDRNPRSTLNMAPALAQSDAFCFKIMVW